ncbi:type II secretion system protein [Glaciecola siphonariae]|uniref:Type II secretion system protein n=1 Tax=Glaciecola siphonariae TaxID=521012 RepID=A0ABV9LYD6_9ALTE
MHASNKGFTLIELVIVIVILSVLAVVAAPRFVDISTDAKVAKLQSISASLKDGSKLMYAEALLNNMAKGRERITLDDGNYAILENGYPVGDWTQGVRHLVNIEWGAFNSDRVCEEAICAYGYQRSIPGKADLTITGYAAVVYLKGYKDRTACLAYYINNEDGSPPIAGTSTDEC